MAHTLAAPPQQVCQPGRTGRPRRCLLLSLGSDDASGTAGVMKKSELGEAVEGHGARMGGLPRAGRL